MKTLLQQLEQLAPLAASATAGPRVATPAYPAYVLLPLIEGQHHALAAKATPEDAAFIAAARNVLTPKNLLALCAALAPQWMAVSDGLPEANEGGHFSKDVLLHFEGLAPSVGYYDYRIGYLYFQTYDDNYSGYVPSFWQALTAPAQ